MNKTELIEHLASKHELSKAEAGRILETLLDAVVTTVKKGWAAQSKNIHPRTPLSMGPWLDFTSALVVTRTPNRLSGPGQCHLMLSCARSPSSPAATAMPPVQLRHEGCSRAMIPSPASPGKETRFQLKNHEYKRFSCAFPLPPPR